MSARKISLGVKAAGDRDITFPPSCTDCLEIFGAEGWGAQTTGVLRACPGLYTDGFTCNKEINI